MKHRILFLVAYFVFWYIYFIDARLLFLFYNYSYSFDMPIADWLRVLIHGTPMDWSVCAYVLALPTLWMSFSSRLSAAATQRFFKVYTLVILVISTGIVVSDMELCRHWNFRMDATALEYLGDPAASFGSIPFWLLLIVLLIGALFAWGYYIVYKWYLARCITWTTCSFAMIPAGVLMLGLLLIPLRGGLKQIPMNDSHVYFHNTNAFANHAATNEVWHFLKALQKRKKIAHYTLMPQAEADEIFDRLFEPIPVDTASLDTLQSVFPDSLCVDGVWRVLNTPQPNVLMIVMESISNRFIEAMGGLPGVTPQLNQLAHEGIRFTRMYAAGDRTDEGLLALQSGYPAYPTFQIMSSPAKTSSMPFITKELQQLGYYTTFVYGGDLNFTGLRSYIHNASYDACISLDDFDKADAKGSKWGVHDEVLLNRLMEVCNGAQQPFFTCCMMGSSHEPYKVPMETVIPGNDNEHQFQNAVYYSDQCLGAFIKAAKQTSWWEHTLVVITADHDSRFPGNYAISDLRRFNIPMFWLGGAVKVQDVAFEEICSQTDAAYTILNQISKTNASWRYSKNILFVYSPRFAFYDFNNGFGWVNDSVRYTFDNVKKTVIAASDSIPEEMLQVGKAYLQSFSNEFIQRGTMN